MNPSTRVLFVEGVPFTGKSTTSEYIAMQLALNGIPARWVSEGTMLTDFFPHVLATFDAEAPLSDEALRANWASFVDAAARAPELRVVDSALSYAALHPLVNVDRPTGEILAWMGEVAALCAPLQPRVIHLTGDMSLLAPASIVQRGEAWRAQLVRQSDSSPYQQARGRAGLEGAIRLLDETQALTRVALAEGWHVLTLDVTAGDWAEYRRAIFDFLALREVEVAVPELPEALLRSYAGSYVRDEPPDPRSTLSLRLEEEGLVLYGADARYELLIPLSERRFHLRASPVDIEVEVEDGVARALVVLSASRGPRRFERVG